MLLLSKTLMPEMDLLMQVAFIACGLYGLHTWRNLHRWSKLAANKILYPYGCPVETCKEPEEFLAYMRPRMLAFSVMALLAGIFSVITTYVLDSNPWCILIVSVLGLGSVIYYMVVINHASRQFW